LRRDFVGSQGRKTEFGGPSEAFSDAGFVQKIKQELMIYYVGVPNHPVN
jgi:hypothetical protein